MDIQMNQNQRIMAVHAKPVEDLPANDLQFIRIEYLTYLLLCLINVGGVHDSMQFEWYLGE